MKSVALVAFSMVFFGSYASVGSARAAADQAQIDEKHASEWSFFERYGKGNLQGECGDIELVADEANWKQAIELQLNGRENVLNVNSFCQDASKILAKYCRAGRKEMVRSHFKKVVCTFDEKSTQK
ncbi:MAG: hypothetical protein AAFY60_06975, partial [Myxococcota bacterium]